MGHLTGRRGSTSVRILSSSPVDFCQVAGVGLASSDGDGKKDSSSNPAVPFLSPVLNCSFESFSTTKASYSTQSTVVPFAQNFSFERLSSLKASCYTQTPVSPARNPQRASLPIPRPSPSRVVTWTEGWVARGYNRDVAVLATKRY